MLLSTAVFALMGALVKIAVRQGVPAAETTFLRFAVGLATMGALAGAGVIPLNFRRKRLLVVRGLFGSISAVLYFESLGRTSLAHATLLSYTYVIFSALFSAAALGERLGSASIGALAVAIGGVAMVTGARLGGVTAGDGQALLSGLLGGVAITSIRELRKTESAAAIFASFCGFGVCTSAVMAGSRWVAPHGWLTLVLAAVAALATAGQLLMTAAYRYCTAALGGLLSLVTVVLSALVGLLWFGERLTLPATIGAFLVLAAAAYLTLLEAGRRSL